MTRIDSIRSKKRKAVFDKANGLCYYCGDEATVTDHVIPRTKGGTNDIENLVAACWTCNNWKKNHDLDHFRKLIFRFTNGIPYFSDAQMEYLIENGFDPYADYRQEDIVFHAEKMGLTNG